MDERGSGGAEARLTGDRRAAREQARARRSRRGQAIAAISSVVVLGGLTALVLTSPGWSEVRDTFFSWTAFKDSFPGVLGGFWLDVKLFLIVEAVVLVLGLLVALIRTSGAAALFPLRVLAVAYCDILRGIPVILLVYLIGFGIPALQLGGLPTDPVALGGWRWRSPTAPTSPRFTGQGSCPCTAASTTRRSRSG